MIEAFAFATCTTVSTLVVLRRFMTWRQIRSYATPIDVVFTVGLVFFLSGTLAGAMAATIAGLLMTLALTGARALYGYDKLTRKGWKIIPAVSIPTVKVTNTKTVAPVVVSMPWPVTPSYDVWK